MQYSIKFLNFILLIVLCMPLSLSADSNKTIRIALDDLPGIDMLNVLTAIERAKSRGLDIKISYLQSEGIAAQAVINGIADIGMGTPYALIQKNKAHIRMFYQLNTLRFHPVINTDFYKEWKDLDGTPMYSHGAGSGTEALMNMMAKRNDITYSDMKYIPGSGVRAKAMLKNRIKATIVDTERRNLLLNHESGRFAKLPMPEIYASDEALYANQDFIDNNIESVQILVEELLHVWQKINQSPDYIVTAREQYNLLPKLSSKRFIEIPTYYQEMVEVGAFSNDGGSKSAFEADLDFYGFAGTLTGDLSTLKEEDFWDFRPLRKALLIQSKY